jgi:hypothetical protein
MRKFHFSFKRKIVDTSVCPNTPECETYKCAVCGQEFCLEHNFHDCDSASGLGYKHDGHNLSQYFISLLPGETHPTGSSFKCMWGQYLGKYCNTCEEGITITNIKINTDALPMWMSPNAPDGIYSFEYEMDEFMGTLHITKVTNYLGSSSGSPLDSVPTPVKADWFINPV